MHDIAPNLLNQSKEVFEPPEYVDPNAPPYTSDPAEGLRMLDEPLPDEELDQINQQARAHIEAMSQRPEEQNYFMRLDSKSIIKTEKEYLFCINNRIPIRVITYAHAKEVLRLEDANKRKARKEKQKKKNSRKSRRKNR